MAKESDFFDPDDVVDEIILPADNVKAWNLTGKPTTDFKLNRIKLLEVVDTTSMGNLKSFLEDIADIKTRNQPINITHAHDAARNFLLEFEDELGKSSSVFVDDILMFYGIATSGLYVTVYGLLEMDGKKMLFISF